MKGISFDNGCDLSYLSTCQDYQVTYRVTAATAAFFLILAITTAGNLNFHYGEQCTIWYEGQRSGGGGSGSRGSSGMDELIL